MRIRKKIRSVLEFFCSLIGIINPIVPKNESKIFIYNSTPTFQNNYAIFNYLIENKYNEKYKIYYYMPEAKKLLQNIPNVVADYSLSKSIFHYITSKYVFFDTGNIRIKPSNNQIVMNLWHGTPFKRIGFLSKNKKEKLPKKLMNTFSKMLVSSNELDEVYIKSFNLNKDQIFHSGHPRNDLLFNNSKPFDKLGINSKKYSKVIMWMTTYRVSKDGRLCHTSNLEWSDTNLPLITNEYNLNILNNMLENYNILLLIKMHTTSEDAKVNLKKYTNIEILEENKYISKDIQLYEILGNCDALITDYSSVFIDYLLIDRPIAFIVDDIEDYDKSNGFNVDRPLDYMPGSHIINFDDLNKFLYNITNNIDLYEEKRKYVSSYFNQYNSRNNCEFILNSMKIKNK